MATISIYSSEPLNTLDRGYTSGPIDMPESETVAKNEYVLQTEAFTKAFKSWDRNNHAIIQLQDDLTGMPIWLSQHQADMVNRAIQDGKDSVDL